MTSLYQVISAILAGSLIAPRGTKNPLHAIPREITESAVISQNPLYYLTANLAFQTMVSNMYKGFVVGLNIRQFHNLVSNCNDEFLLCKFCGHVFAMKFLLKNWQLNAWQKTKVFVNYPFSLPLSHGIKPLCTNRFLQMHHQNLLYTHITLSALTVWM